MSINERDLGRLLIEELAQVAGALGGGTASTAASTAPEGHQWTASISADGAVRATCVLTFDEAGAAALANAVVEKHDNKSIEGVLRDAITQAIDGVMAHGQAPEVHLTLTQVARSEAPPSGVALSADAITTGMDVPLIVGYYAVMAPTVPAAKARHGQKTLTADQQQARLDVILDIDLPVVVRFGRTEMALRAVTRIAPGSVIDLGRSPDDPVELLVSDRVVARGEVVVVGGNYGIRIVDVVSPSERMRSMEG